MYIYKDVLIYRYVYWCVTQQTFYINSHKYCTISKYAQAFIMWGAYQQGPHGGAGNSRSAGTTV